MITDNKDELSHAGIKGMRWGVRRYQNADGSLTEAGKKRYADPERAKKDLESTNTILRETGNASRTASGAVKNARVNVKRMDLSRMTDKELRDRIAREQLESQYDGMFNPERKRVESGKRAVSDVLDGLGTAATLTASALSIALAVKALRS